MRAILVTSMALLKHSLSFHNKSNNNILWLFFSKEIETLYQHNCRINLMSLKKWWRGAWIERYKPRSQSCFLFMYLQIISVMSKWDNGHHVCASMATTQYIILSPSSLSPQTQSFLPSSLPTAPATPFLSLLSFNSSAIWDKFVGVFVLCCVIDPKLSW